MTRHYTAVQTRSRAQYHVQALRTLSRETDRLKKLEEAVWSGRGADGWVVDELLKQGDEAGLKGTKVMLAIEVSHLVRPTSGHKRLSSKVMC